MVRRFIVMIALLIGCSQAAGTSIKPQRVAATAQADTAQVVPGRAFTIAVNFILSPRVHIYWANPGDSGLATSVKFTLPSGFVAGETQFPTPEQITGPLSIVSYGYQGQVTLLTTITPPKDLAPGQVISIDAQVDWMACDDDSCVSESTKLNLKLVSGEKVEPVHVPQFSQYRSALPQSIDESQMLGAAPLIEPAGENIYRITLKWRQPVQDVQFFAPPVKQMPASVVSTESQEIQTIVVLRSKAMPVSSAKSAMGVVRYRASDGQSRGLMIPIFIQSPAEK